MVSRTSNRDFSKGNIRLIKMVVGLVEKLLEFLFNIKSIERNSGLGFRVRLGLGGLRERLGGLRVGLGGFKLGFRVVGNSVFGFGLGSSGGKRLLGGCATTSRGTKHRNDLNGFDVIGFGFLWQNEDYRSLFFLV